MAYTSCFFAIVCALFMVAMVAAYRQQVELERALYVIAKRNRQYNQLIARYEIAIQSLPEETQKVVIQKIREGIENDFR